MAGEFSCPFPGTGGQGVHKGEERTIFMDTRTTAATIRRAVNVKELAARYGYIANRAGFICCPLHREKTPSLHLNSENWHCFGCKEGGDAISFVMKLDGLSFWDACRKIDSLFGLGLFGEVHPVIARALQRKAERAAQERATQQSTVEQLEAEYWSAFDSWRVLDAILSASQPQTPEEITEEYALALREIDGAAQAVREVEWALFDALGIRPNPEYYTKYSLRGDPA